MIVTHTSPDLDAIASVWLLKRFGNMENEPVGFVNTGNPDPAMLKNAAAVVDTGKVHNEATLRFDHHQFTGAEATETCAADLVYRWLIRRGYGVSYQAEDWGHHLVYLEPLINLVTAGDTGRKEANASREVGLHAIFSGLKSLASDQKGRKSDQELMEWGFTLLDCLEAHLRHRAEHRLELKSKTVYKSDDGLIWAIKHGSQGSSFAAFDEGARLVVFEGEPIEVEGGTTYPVGIMRGGEWTEPHAGEIVKDVLLSVTDLTTELETWYLHPAGFFGGRGTAKAPNFEPVEISLVELAKAVDAAWKR